MLRKLLLFLALFMFIKCNAGSQSIENTPLHVFATSNTIGYVTPCG